VAVDYEPVAGYTQDAMLAGKCQFDVDGVPAFTRRHEHEGGLFHAGLRGEAVRVIDRMEEVTGAM
jgi:hypothetical protein